MISPTAKAETKSRTEPKTSDLRERTKQFSYRVIRLSRALPHTREADVLGRQLLRSATSVGANYRAAGRARSRAEFIAKLGIVLEEADESVYWLECLANNGIVRHELLGDLIREAKELAAIFTSSSKTARLKK